MTDPKTTAASLRHLHRAKIHAMTAPGGRVVYSIHGTDETLRPLLDAADLLEQPRPVPLVSRTVLGEPIVARIEFADAELLADLQAMEPGDVQLMPGDAPTVTHARITEAAQQVREMDLANPYWCGAVEQLCSLLGVQS